MRLFFTQTSVINLHNIASINFETGVVFMVSGNTISLSIRETQDIRDVIEEIHRQSCEQKQP
jgi:hypothetical protein